MKSTVSITMGLPQLDIHSLSEDWALAAGLEQTWLLLAESLGRRPSDWLDGQGERMYGAVMALSTRFDLIDIIREDDVVAVEAEIIAVRKPHALARITFSVGGKAKAEVQLLTSFIKRVQASSNKKFSKVRDVWQAEDFKTDLIDDLLAQHHAAKSEMVAGKAAMDYEVNRIQDFNTADFLYFKNFVRIAKAGEWRENRGQPTRLNSERICFYYGNVEDGETIRVFVKRTGDHAVTVFEDSDGRRLFLSRLLAPEVKIAAR